MSKDNTVKIVFDTPDQAAWFLKYMDCFGEQAYWEWMSEHPKGKVKHFFYEKSTNTIIGTNKTPEAT